MDRFVVAPFPTIVENPDAVVDSINDRFGTALAPVGTDPGSRERIFAAIDEKQRTVHGEDRDTALPRPDPGRADAARHRREELAATVPSTVLAAAEGLHERLTAR